jgi:toxin ParE1/3/4
MHARFTDDALADLKAIQQYLEPRNVQALERILSAIFTTIGQLESFPFLGRSGRVEGTYEITVPRTPFFIVYSLPDEYYIDIERVFHTRQKYLPSED